MTKRARAPRPAGSGGELRQALAAVLVAAIAAGSVMTAFLLHRQELNLVDRRERSLAQQAALALETDLSQTFGALRGSGAVVRGDGTLDRRAFVAFSAALIGDPAVAAAGLLEKVDQADRDRWEAENRMAITDRSPDAAGQFQPAPPRDWYFPLAVVSPDAPHLRAALGFDLASDAARGPATLEAIRLGTARLTAPTALAPTGQPGVVAIQPLFRRDASLATPEERLAALVGAVVVAYSADEVASRAVGQLPADARVRISDGSSVIFDAGGGGRAVQRFEVAGRTWQVRAGSAEGPRLVLPLIALVGGLGLDLVLALVLIRTFRSDRDRERVNIALAAAQREAVGLQELAARLSGSLTVDEVAGVVLRSGSRLLGATGGQLAVVIDERQRLGVIADHPPVHSEVSSSQPRPVEAGSLAEAAASGRPLWDEDESVLALPFLSDGRVLGACTFRLRQPGPDPASSSVALSLAALTTGALRRADRYEIEHDVADTLQRSLLPARLESPSGVRVAARYRPGTRGLAVGGDWYDVIPLPDGRVGVVVGDVVGRGARAAAVMGQLRSTLHVIALGEPSPAGVLASLDAHSSHIEDALCSTVVYAVLDPVTGELVFACAGHPPPLLLSESARFLDGAKAPPLGTRFGDRAREVRARLQPGDALLLYTDGAVERRGESIDVGLDRLAHIASTPAGDIEVLLDRILDQIGSDGTDDIALLAVQWIGRSGDAHGTATDATAPVVVATTPEPLGRTPAR